MANQQENKKEISLRHKLFCHLYLGIGMNGQCYMNAGMAYMHAFWHKVPPLKETDPKTGRQVYSRRYNTARTNASRLLTKANIQDYLKECLDGVDTNEAKRELAKLIRQDKNLYVKKGAIDTKLKIDGQLDDTGRAKELDALGGMIKTILEGGKQPAKKKK